MPNENKEIIEQKYIRRNNGWEFTELNKIHKITDLKNSENPSKINTKKISRQH